MIVLDASLLVARILNEQIANLEGDIFNQIDTTRIVVPAHWPAEIANALRTNVRRGRITLADLEAVGNYLSKLQVTISPSISLDLIEPLARFAAIHNLTAYDALYVQLAMEQNASLATVDADMRTAARNLNVALFPA